MPRGFTQAEKLLIREQLLEQGYKQFSAYGLKKTSVDDLSRAVGISKGAFYLFFTSKETLFMEVIEQAEASFRQIILAELHLPGPSPRLRFVAVLKKSFTLWKTIPLLHVFTSSDYAHLARSVPPETIQAHLQSDRVFIDDFISQCRQASIPILATADQVDGLLHAIFFTSLHENDLGQGSISPAIDILLELTAAFCLGEIELHTIPTAVNE
jgi:AcrR family transcriptional regulator